MTTKQRINKYNLELTADEAYTLQLLLAFVAGDSESYRIYEKLCELTGEEMDTEDFNRAVFAIEGCYSHPNKEIETGEDESVVIRFN